MRLGALDSRAALGRTRRLVKLTRERCDNFRGLDAVAQRCERSKAFNQ